MDEGRCGNLDTKKLEAMMTAVEQGSFTRAADMLGYTQSGLTHMMNSLEKDVGFPLLVRGHYGVKLTPAGVRVEPLIHRLLAADEELKREIMLINTAKEETVRVASYASIAMHWLPEMIQQFRTRYPGVHVDIQMGSVEEVYRWVREDKADMCFASRQEGMTLEWIHLKDDPMLVILPKNDRAAGQTSFSVRHFDGREFLMPSMGFSLDIGRVFDSFGVHPLIRHTQVSDSVVISMVEHGLGISILSELVLKGRKNDVLALPMNPPAVRELGVAVRSKKELRPAARRFLAEAVDMIETM